MAADVYHHSRCAAWQNLDVLPTHHHPPIRGRSLFSKVGVPRRRYMRSWKGSIWGTSPVWGCSPIQNFEIDFLCKCDLKHWNRMRRRHAWNIQNNNWCIWYRSITSEVYNRPTKYNTKLPLNLGCPIILSLQDTPLVKSWDVWTPGHPRIAASAYATNTTSGSSLIVILKMMEESKEV